MFSGLIEGHIHPSDALRNTNINRLSSIALSVRVNSKCKLASDEMWLENDLALWSSYSIANANKI